MAKKFARFLIHPPSSACYAYGTLRERIAFSAGWNCQLARYPPRYAKSGVCRCFSDKFLEKPRKKIRVY